MRISSLFGRHNPVRARIEPTKSNVADSWTTSRSRILESLSEPMTGDDYTMGHGVRDDLRSSDAVFGLIGTSASADGTDMRARRTGDGVTSSASDLMKSLYGQYCRALDDPQASLGGDWTTQAMPPGDYGADPTSLTDYAHKPVPSFESIETFLTGAYRMEHAFGPMGIDEARELVATEPVPEILRLFAPAEHAASVRRRASALPPALARREHHALGIDSPLSVPQSAASLSDAS
jgi:hypothetical protein